MNNQLKPSQQQPWIHANASSDRFDFESWVAQVKPQLLAALQRRSAESHQKS